MGCPRPNTPRSDPKDMSQLTGSLRSRLQTMMDDAPGGILGLVSGRRDAGTQWDLRHARCPDRECDGGCRGNPLTALPGKSNHQRGTAADISGSRSLWANQNKSRYGLATPVRGEPWHFEARGHPSVAIRQFGDVGPTEDQLRKGVRRGMTDAFDGNARKVRGIISWERYLQVLLDAARKR